MSYEAEVQVEAVRAILAEWDDRSDRHAQTRVQMHQQIAAALGTKVEWLPHHVVLKNGREDIVCACGEHFRQARGLGNVPTGLDAIRQWVAHWHAENGKPTFTRDDMAECWRASGEAHVEWVNRNPGPSGIWSDPPNNPHDEETS